MIKLIAPRPYKSSEKRYTLTLIIGFFQLNIKSGGSLTDLIYFPICSKMLEREVLEGLHGAVAPVEHPLRLRNLQHPVDGELRHLLEMTTT